MHIMDCNGIANIAVSSVVAPLCYDARLGPNRQARLDVINGLMSEYYTNSKADVSSRMPPLKLQYLFNNQGWEMLSGQAVKAASTRHLVNFLSVLVDKYYNDESVEENRLVGRVVRSLSKVYATVYSSGFALSPDDGNDLRRLMFRFGASMQNLRELKRLANVQGWQIIIKAHYMQHLADMAQVLNPRWLQVYQEESNVGIMARIWQRSAAGRYRARAQKLVLLKRLTSWYVRLEGM